jgi:hypothetical protein
MKTLKPVVAATELLLILPAALFMTALFLREVQPQQFEPAHTAALIVNWYVHGPVWLTLWILLMALPLAVFLLGGATLLRAWKSDEALRHAVRQIVAVIRLHIATLLIVAATLTAAGILGIVALHAVTD